MMPVSKTSLETATAKENVRSLKRGLLWIFSVVLLLALFSTNAFAQPLTQREIQEIQRDLDRTSKDLTRKITVLQQIDQNDVVYMSYICQAWDFLWYITLQQTVTEEESRQMVRALYDRIPTLPQETRKHAKEFADLIQSIRDEHVPIIIEVDKAKRETGGIPLELEEPNKKRYQVKTEMDPLFYNYLQEYVNMKKINHKGILAFSHKGLGPMLDCPGRYYKTLFEERASPRRSLKSNVDLIRGFCNTKNDFLNPNYWRDFSGVTKELGFEEWSKRCDKMALYLEGKIK